nr:FHIPEP family type III secretion protein [Bacillus subtilis]
MSTRDLSVLISVVLIVAMLVIPFPPWLLSILIIINISLALIVLLTTMNMQEALQFSIFPSLLLLLTLFRLGLNVSTTRSILSHGEGGKVVETFGNFVVGGNVLVGLVVFIILIIIQFIVITKGAERVSEVAARFTLDAMPGKQMSIDADLNAGMITEQEAKHRREKVAREADFYGAMDGASKFVKGDAIAGIIIVMINIIFGIVIGMLQQGMSIQEAASHFTMLTVGDGIVSQIPALLISTATGIVVTRAASEGNLGHDITVPAVCVSKAFIRRSSYDHAFRYFHSDRHPSDGYCLRDCLLLAHIHYLNQVRKKKRWMRFLRKRLRWTSLKALKVLFSFCI